MMTETKWNKIEPEPMMDALSDSLWGASDAIRQTLEAVIESHLAEAEHELGPTLVYLESDEAREHVEYVLDQLWAESVDRIGEGIRRGIVHWIESGRGVPEGIAA